MVKQHTYMQTAFQTASAVPVLPATIFGETRTGHGGIKQAIGPTLEGATVWINTQPLTLADLRGKVVLVDFWTYTCINWRRTLPYIRLWEERYKDQGLVVIGVHTPEFSFEFNLSNVTRSVKQMNIDYPVVTDNNYEIWHSFNNNYWPALYLIDAKGSIRYQKFGEADYEEIEMQIQELLKDVSAENSSVTHVAIRPEGFEIAADWEHLQSPENYLGYERTESFASPDGVIGDKPVHYSLPQKLKLNQWAISGEWNIGKERILLGKRDGRIVNRFHARDLHLIMGPAKAGNSMTFRVLIDGKPPGSAHGLDVDGKGNGAATEQRMYQLIRQQGSIADREFQIEFFDPGVKAFAFTFG
jgi:thiol-disulfide isomerase/thioredoxin